MSENYDKEQLEEKLFEINKDLNEWETVFASDAWKVFEEFAAELLHTRREYMELTPPRGLDDAIERTFMSGEIAALRLVTEHPKSQLETLRETAQSLRDMLRSLEDNDEDPDDA